MKDDEKKEDKEMEKAGCPHFMKGEHCKCGGCKHHTGGKEVEKGTSDNNTLTAKEGVSGSATAPSMPPHMQNAASAQDVIRSQNIKKAEPEVNVDEIVKAALTTKADEITKAFQSQIDELKAELEKVKEQPIVKSAVVIPEQVEGTVGSSNYKALGKFMKKRG